MVSQSLGKELSGLNDFMFSTRTRHNRSTNKKKEKHTARKSKSVTLLSNTTAGNVAYAHGSTNPIKIGGRLTEAMG